MSTGTTPPWQASPAPRRFSIPRGVALPQNPVNQTATKPGTGLELTLDEPLQYETEQALAAEIVSSHASSGTAVVMDVKSGQILSMANLVATSPAPASGSSTPASGAGPIPIGPTDRSTRRRPTSP